MIDDIKHVHKYFAFQTKKDFEPVETDGGSQLYQLVEYVYSACSCGVAIKARVGDE